MAHVAPVTLRPDGYRRRVLSRLLASFSALALGGVVLVVPGAAGAPQPEDGTSTSRAWQSAGPVDSVLVVSLDGLNPDALRVLGRSGTPHLHAFMRDGASTRNARTSYEQTKTLPNHTGMVTGRRIDARRGGHGVTWNDDRLLPGTVQEAAGEPVASVFTVVDEAGGSTALFASKTKFSLFERSWPDAVDQTTIIEANGRLVSALAEDLAAQPRAFRFLHLSLPDAVGHDHGFMSRAYLRAVRRTDRLVGRVVAAVRDTPGLADRTAIVLTSDHGGRGPDHADAARLANYRVAFMVQGPGVDAGADLYELNPDLRDPRRGRPEYDASRQPVRNGMVANLSLDLLDLGPVPDSELNEDQELDVSAQP